MMLLHSWNNCRFKERNLFRKVCRQTPVYSISHLYLLVRYSVTADDFKDQETEENLQTARQMTARFQALETENKRLRLLTKQSSIPSRVKHSSYTVSERAAIFRDWSTVPSIGTLKPSTPDSSRNGTASTESRHSKADADSSTDALASTELAPAVDVDEVVETEEAVGLPAVGELCELLDAFEANGLRHQEPRCNFPGPLRARGRTTQTSASMH